MNRKAYVGSAVDACWEASARLVVVIRMLQDHDCPASPATMQKETHEDDDEGYDILMVRSLLHDIRHMLRDAAANDVPSPTAAQTPKGAR